MFCELRYFPSADHDVRIQKLFLQLKDVSRINLYLRPISLGPFFGTILLSDTTLYTFKRAYLPLNVLLVKILTFLAMHYLGRLFPNLSLRDHILGQQIAAALSTADRKIN